MNVITLGVVDFALSMTTVFACKFLCIPAGNSNTAEIIEKFRDDPIGSGFYATVVAPIQEEIVFRGIPIALLWLFGFTYPGSHNWVAGFFMAFLFALVHGIVDENGDLKLPIPQFFGGLFLWYIAREYGVITAIFTHGIHNAIICLILLFKLR